MLQQLKKAIPQDFLPRLWYHQATTMLGNWWYKSPAKELFCIGVTGTDGKTTTVQMLTRILHQAGVPVGMTSTQGFQIGDQVFRNATHKTTLGRFGLPRMLRSIVKAGCTHAVIEVSSHALCQHRTWGIPFKRAVFTNLSREHLDYHRTMEAYRNAKAKLFIMTKQRHGVAILNADEEASAYIHQVGPRETIWYGIQESEAPVKATNIQYGPTSTTFELHIGEEARQMTTRTVGVGNVYNMLAAAACAHSLDVAFDDIVQGLESFPGVPGRMETHLLPNGAHVIIDYAVTPKALTSLYETVRLFTKGKTMAVLGACGDRDQGKRPEMGRLAAVLTDKVFLTSEEPYTEDPMTIIRMLESGVLQAGETIGQGYELIEDRRTAITKALSEAGPEDTVVISGMGDQDSMIIGTKKIPWSDREVVQDVIQKLQ